MLVVAIASAAVAADIISSRLDLAKNSYCARVDGIRNSRSYLRSCVVVFLSNCGDAVAFRNLLI